MMAECSPVEEGDKLRFAPEEIIEQIEQHWRNLLLIRSVSPYVKDFMTGRKDSPTAPYYKNRGYGARVCFDEALTLERIEAINLATHWVNQGFVVWLYAFLEYCRVYKRIYHDIDGHDDIDILRWLRKWFVHTPGCYNPNDSEQKDTYESILKHFNLDRRDHPESDRLFPIPIDRVLEPLVDGCKKYVVGLHNRQTQNNPGGGRAAVAPDRAERPLAPDD
jgi:hypothetical protein